MSIIAGVLIASIAFSALMAFAWWVQRTTGNSGWIDVVWTAGVGLTATFLALSVGSGAVTARQAAVAGLAALWSLRLGTHLFVRTATADDDPRYRDLIEQWGTAASRKMFAFLQVQAAAGLVLATAVMIAARSPGVFPGPGDIAGLAVFAAGLIGSTTADLQLRRFKAENARKLCDRGLWRWSRHPNYFFEWMCWLSYPLIAVDPGGPYIWGYAALAAPLWMYWLLVHVSGIPPLEMHLMRSRGAAFIAYRMRTSIFFPWPPKRG
ncbi:MAG: DUF1295 domain-containing protein [Rhodospirillaceae bacterium]